MSQANNKWTVKNQTSFPYRGPNAAYAAHLKSQTVKTPASSRVAVKLEPAAKAARKQLLPKQLPSAAYMKTKALQSDQSPFARLTPSQWSTEYRLLHRLTPLREKEFLTKHRLGLAHVPGAGLSITGLPKNYNSYDQSSATSSATKANSPLPEPTISKASSTSPMLDRYDASGDYFLCPRESAVIILNQQRELHNKQFHTRRKNRPELDWSHGNPVEVGQSRLMLGTVWATAISEMTLRLASEDGTSSMITSPNFSNIHEGSFWLAQLLTNHEATKLWCFGTMEALEAANRSLLLMQRQARIGNLQQTHGGMVITDNPMSLLTTTAVTSASLPNYYGFLTAIPSGFKLKEELLSSLPEPYTLPAPNTHLTCGKAERKRTLPSSQEESNTLSVIPPMKLSRLQLIDKGYLPVGHPDSPRLLSVPDQSPSVPWDQEVLDALAEEENELLNEAIKMGTLPPYTQDY